LEGLDLNDGDSDDYDFMDDVDNGNGRTRRRQQPSKVKYMKLLQHVADRKTAQITIELDDLEEVWHALDVFRYGERMDADLVC
jgi:DNA replication licensing factor MCM7